MRILIVEDDIAFQRVLAAILRRVMPHATFSTCTSVDEAKQILSVSPTDIVLLDMILLGGNGVDVLRAFSNPEFSVICMTAQEFNVPLQQEALANGASAMLWKPFDPEELKATLHHVVKMRLRVLNKPIGGDEMIVHHSQSIVYSLPPKPQMEEMVDKTEATDVILRDNVFSLPTDDGLVFLPLREIICIEAANNYTIVYRSNGQPMTVRIFLQSYEKFLPQPEFFRPNRSFIVNMRFVKEVSKNNRTMILTHRATEKPIIVSRAKMKFINKWRTSLKMLLQKMDKSTDIS